MKNAPDKKSIESAPSKRNHTSSFDLFPDSLPPTVPAFWPTRGTRADEALQSFFTGAQNQADYWHGWRLAAYVKELEYLGWRFIRRDIVKPNCRRPITEYDIDRTDAGTAAALTSRQKGNIDLTLAGLLVFGGVCASLLMMVLS